MLRHMEILHRETQPNGRLVPVKYQFRSLATKDFALPAALLTVELRHLSGPDNANPPTGGTINRQRQIMRSLEITGSIWQEMSHTSLDAYKAATVLNVALESVRNAKTAGVGQSAPDGPPCNPLDYSLNYSDMKPEQSAAVGLGMLAGSISPESPGTINNKLPPLSQMNLPGSIPAEPVLPPDIQFDAFGGVNRVQSPLSMFAQLGGNGPEIVSDIDWVSMNRVS